MFGLADLVPILMGVIVVLFLLQGTQGVAVSDMVGAVVSVPFVALDYLFATMGSNFGGLVLGIATLAWLAFESQMALAFISLESVAVVAVFLFVLMLVA